MEFENFFRRWEEYQAGFGDLSKEFWLGCYSMKNENISSFQSYNTIQSEQQVKQPHSPPGNEMIHELTRDSNQKLVVELTDASGLLRYAMYNTFTIADEADDYRLQVLRTRGDGVVGMRFAIAEMIQKKLINLI